MNIQHHALTLTQYILFYSFHSNSSIDLMSICLYAFSCSGTGSGSVSAFGTVSGLGVAFVLSPLGHPIGGFLVWRNEHLWWLPWSP